MGCFSSGHLVLRHTSHSGTHLWKGVQSQDSQGFCDSLIQVQIVPEPLCARNLWGAETMSWQGKGVSEVWISKQRSGLGVGVPDMALIIYLKPWH